MKLAFQWSVSYLHCLCNAFILAPLHTTFAKRRGGTCVCSSRLRHAQTGQLPITNKNVQSLSFMCLSPRWVLHLLQMFWKVEYLQTSICLSMFKNIFLGNHKKKSHKSTSFSFFFVLLALPKKRACSNKGRWRAQSSLTLWSTTISVMKMTAILHLEIKSLDQFETSWRWEKNQCDNYYFRRNKISTL